MDKKKAGGMLALLAGIWSLFWNAGGKELTTEATVGTITGLRKKVGETIKEAKGSIVDERLFNIAINEGFRKESPEKCQKIKEFWYALQEHDEKNDTDEAPAFILFVAKMLILSAELWERQNRPTTTDSSRDKKEPKETSGDEYVSYRTGIKEAVIWIGDLLKVGSASDDKKESFGLMLEYLERENVHELISEKKPTVVERGEKAVKGVRDVGKELKDTPAGKAVSNDLVATKNIIVSWNDAIKKKRAKLRGED